MGVGPYLHESSLVSGVWPLRILSDQSRPAIPPSAVHLNGEAKESQEPVPLEMVAPSHRAHDQRECLELDPLLAEDRMGLEEGDDLLDEIRTIPHHVDE